MDPVAADAIVALAAIAAGYVVGSVPVSPLVGRAAGVDALREGDRNPGAANVWKLAGPGWGLLAFTGDLAKGALPVSIGLVSVSWGVGWAAGLGAVVGAGWPALGRLRGGRAVGTFAGAIFALGVPAGLASTGLGLTVVLAGRAARRNPRVGAITAAVGSYPLLFLALEQDVARLAAVLLLYLVTMARYVLTRPGRPGRPGRHPADDEPPRPTAAQPRVPS